MGYPTDDGSYSRAGTGRRPEWPSPAGYGEPAGYGAYQDYGDTSGLADPYGPPGTQIDRDPVRGYPPAPDVYIDDGYGAGPGYGEAPYADPAYAPGPGYGGGPDYGYAPGPEPGYGPGYQADTGYAAAPVYTDQAFHDGTVYHDPSGGYDTGYDAYEQQPGPGGVYPDGPPPEVPSYPGYESDPYNDPEPVPSGPGSGNGGRAAGRPGKAAKAPKPAKAKRGRLSMVLAVTAGIVVLAVGATAYLLLTKPKPTPPAVADTGPTGQVQVPPGPTSSAAAACTSHLGQYCHIETRTLDPTPLSVTEVFPAQFMTMSDHSSFVDEAHENSKDCTGAVIGSGLQSAIKSGQCSQVLLASYVSGDNKMMGTIGVFNLSSTTAAEKAGHAVDGSDFLSPMSTSKGVTKSLGKGTGVVEAEFKGHYLILTWAEFTNLKTPDSHGDKVLETFESDLVSGTANIALSERMVTGKPASSSS